MILGKLLQPLKTSLPILVKLLGNSILVKLLQSKKAYPPIILVLSLILNDVKSSVIVLINTKYGFSSFPKYFPFSYSLYFKLLQSKKAYPPILVKLLGKVILVKLLQ